jgi:fructose-bisphosphate aldolase class II
LFGVRELGFEADKRPKGVANGDQQASIAGAIAGAHYIRAVAPSYGIPVILHTDHCAKKLLPWLDGMMDEDEKHFKEHGEPLFSSHMIDLSEEDVEWNIQTTAKYLKRAAPMKQWLEMVRICRTRDQGND